MAWQPVANGAGGVVVRTCAGWGGAGTGRGTGEGEGIRAGKGIGAGIGDWAMNSNSALASWSIRQRRGQSAEG
eukprot:6348736-Ditylum_brightwellii.AAC.1